MVLPEGLSVMASSKEVSFGPGVPKVSTTIPPSSSKAPMSLCTMPSLVASCGRETPRMSVSGIPGTEAGTTSTRGPVTSSGNRIGSPEARVVSGPRKAVAWIRSVEAEKCP